MELKINSSESGQKLLKYLLRKTDGSKVFLYKMFRKRNVKVNGLAADQNYLTKSGDIVYMPGVRENINNNKFRNVEPDIMVLYLDENLAAIDKDEDTLVHGAKGIQYRDTLVEKLKSYLYYNKEPYDFVIPLHRIDRNTRGVVLFARNFETSKKYSQLFKEGKITKIYHVLLNGILEKTLFIEADIIRFGNEEDEYNKVEVKNLSISEKIPSKKEWLEMKYSKSKSISATLIRPVSFATGRTKAEVTIWTGRHHQIRAICEAIGFPVAGDKKYCARKQYQGLKNKIPHSKIKGNLSAPVIEPKSQALICKKMIIEEIGLTIESRQSLDNLLLF